jgi:hypothetical protein
MSRKIKSTRIKRKGNHTKKKIKGGADADGSSSLSNIPSNLRANTPDNKRREYTVILLENSGIDPTNIITDDNLNAIKINDKIQEKILEKMKKIEEMGVDEDKKTSMELDYHTKYEKFQVNGVKIIESGLHVGEESINNSSLVGKFKRHPNTSHKKYLGIILDLTHFETETSLDGSEIIKIFRDVILFPGI